MPAQLQVSGNQYLTFLGCARINTSEVPPGSVVVSGAPWDATPTPFGAKMGPNGTRVGSQLLADRLRTAGSKGLIDVDTGRQLPLDLLDGVFDVGDFTVYPTDIMKTTESIAAGVYEVVRRGAFSIVIGGDHYASYPACLGWNRAVMEKNPKTRIGYLHLDGHLDFTAINPIYGKYNNGANARLISELPGVSVSNMAWIGTTCMVADEPLESIRRNGAVIVTAQDVHRLGPAEAARRAAEHAIQGCDVLYMTLDIDVVDTGYLPGTGCADHTGITPADLRDILRVLAQYPLGAMDVMEVAPRLDPSGRSTSFAAELMLDLIATRRSARP